MSSLTEAQKQQIAERLASRKAELYAEIQSDQEREQKERYVDIAGEVGDPGDSSVADTIMDQDLSIERRQLDEIAQIEAAEKRLSSPNFGECVECGGDIGFERLMLTPTATRCTECQTQHEKTFASNGPPKL